MSIAANYKLNKILSEGVAKAKLKKESTLNQTPQANAPRMVHSPLDPRRRAMSQTTFTGPLGMAGSAVTARKMLLGQ